MVTPCRTGAVTAAGAATALLLRDRHFPFVVKLKPLLFQCVECILAEFALFLCLFPRPVCSVKGKFLLKLGHLH